MFWDDIKLVTEQIEKYGLREPFVDLGGLDCPTIADYELTIKTGDQYARYLSLNQRPFDHICSDYQILNPENGDPMIEDLPTKYKNVFGTAVCLNVIEHIDNPIQVFQSFYDIMKPDSLLIVSTVFTFPYHPSPRDYWRYSPDCLQYLAEFVGFQVLECDWRLYVPANDGILEIKNQTLQEIRSVFITLTKGNFTTVLPKKHYILPERYSRNEIANQWLNWEFLSNHIHTSLSSKFSYLDSNSWKQTRQMLVEFILNLPPENLESFYLKGINTFHQKFVDCDFKLDEFEEKDFIAKIVKTSNQSILLPDFQYIPEGWTKQDSQIKGWDVESILDIRKSQWSQSLGMLNNNQPIANNYGTHNTYMSYSYVLALASRHKDNLSILDWGGGLGDYYMISQSLIPDLKIDYYCREVTVLCKAGSKLTSEIHYYDNDDDCFKQDYDMVLASSSLQYFTDWKKILQQLTTITKSYIYITRLPLVHHDSSFVVLQRAYQYGYDTEYLGWVFNRQEFLDWMINDLEMKLVREFLIAEQFSITGTVENVESRGFLFTHSKD